MKRGFWPASERACASNCDSTRATAVRSESGSFVSRAAYSKAAREPSGIGQRSPLADVAGIAGMCLAGTDGLPAVAFETVTVVPE